MSEPKIVLVTGTSSGIGRIIAAHLASAGHRVFAGSLDAACDPPLSGVTTLPLDVRDDASVERCVANVLASAGPIDVLVNNAGYAMGGALEETSIDEAKAQFDTNFFGVARMINAVLPAMRKRGIGQIINIGSGAGITAEPFAGYYTSTKFALEGYTEALRHEVAPFGIKVSVVEPGWFRTSIVQNAKRPATPMATYDRLRESVFRLVTRYCDEGADPILVARCVESLMHARRPRVRCPVGTDVTWSARLRRLLPERLYQWLVGRYYGLHLAEGTNR
jgi:NAD(P)-dependent dehydrogenase (short-subunit alcohol dehydrogenase family)